MKTRFLLTVALSLSASTGFAQNAIFGKSNGAPPVSSVGREADWFLDIDTGKVYGPKLFGAWGAANFNILNSPALPALTTNVESTGIPGLDMNNCTSVSTCGWFLWSVPTAYPHASIPTLRLTKGFPSAGGGTSGNVYTNLWALTSTGENDRGYIWAVQSELHNRTKASTGAQNVAVAGTVFKELGSNTVGTQIGPSWGLYGDCSNTIAEANPTASCLGAEIDTYSAIGSGTDNNFQRVALQLVGGVFGGTDAGVHIGTLILAGAGGGATIDRVFYLGAGSYGRGFDVAKGTFTGPVLNLAQGQAIAFDADGNGNFNRSWYYQTGSLAYKVVGSVVMTLSDAGSLNINGGFNAGTSYALAQPFAVNTAPTISSGFCTSPSVGAGANGTLAFEINVGSACATGAGVIGMPTATNGWICDFHDTTSPGSTVIEFTAHTANTVTIQAYARSNGAVSNFTSGGVIHAKCVGY